MKINYSLPTLGELFSHDAPLYKILTWALPAFILISSITVFGGVRSHLGDYLEQYPLYITAPAYSFAYLVFSLAPDVLNAVLIAYVVRSLLKKFFFSGTGIILNLFAIGLSIFLTNYSFNMSQLSATAAADAMGAETEEIELQKINTEYSRESRDIINDYNQDKTDVNAQHRAAIDLLGAKYSNKIEPLKNKIIELERGRYDGNTQWTDREQRKLRNKINKLEGDQVNEAGELLKDKNKSLALLAERKQTAQDNLIKYKNEDRTTEKRTKERKNEAIRELNLRFKTELSRIAKFAVFIILILASLKEIIHYRNDIEPQPILTNLDFQFNWLREFLSYPFVFVQRYAVNLVRKKYAALPPLEAPEEIPDLEEHDRQQRVIPLRAKTQKATFFREGLTMAENRNTTLIVKDEKTKTCPNCHKSFTYKNANKKYCGNRCRIESWQNRTGRKVKFGKK